MDFVDESATENGAKKLSEEKVKKKVVIDDSGQKRGTKLQNDSSKGLFRQNIAETTWSWRISVIRFLIGYLFQVLSYGTPYWLVVVDAEGEDVMHVGIWSTCFTISSCTYRGEISDCVNAVRVFGGIGVVSGLVVTCLSLIFVKKTLRTDDVWLFLLCFVSSMSNQKSTVVFRRAVGCFYTADLPFMSEFKWTWSLALAFTFIIQTVAAGLVFLILEVREISRQRRSRRPWNGRGIVIT